MRGVEQPQLKVETRHRLARVLGMIGSAHDNEALAAARMADRLVRGEGLTWFDVLATTEPCIDVLMDWPVRWQAAARFVADDGPGLVREKDLTFAETVAQYQHRPTDKQLIYLRDLVRRVLEARP
jgi:hypothetical protein